MSITATTMRRLKRSAVTAASVALLSSGLPSVASGAASGQLYAFGANHYGQLGSTTSNGTENPNPNPAPVALPGATGAVTQVAAGGEHSLALTSTDELYAFGVNAYGQLGTETNSGSFEPNPTPARVTLPGQNGPVTQIAAGRPGRRRR
jgi:alpha-tubulin suppressor-like RCC1 family protein